MQYTLHKANDLRDNCPMYWLLATDGHETRLAVFSMHPAPSRIKHRTHAIPSSITWESDYAWQNHADISTASIVDTWESAE